MSKIKFFGLGGLGENGKNMYVCEVDERIFILDAGLKYPSVDLYGVDTIIPDIQYLKDNRDRIQGIFLSHGHEDHIGACVEVLKEFDVGVFGTHFTISILEDNIVEAGLKLSDYRLYRINEDKKLKFGNVTVEFYNVSHSIPETVHIAICTKDGAIVYAPDFSFDTNTDRKYRTNFSRINDIAKHGVLALATESLGTSNIDRAANNMILDHYIEEALLVKQRLIFSMFSTDLDRIQRVINLCVEQGRRVAIIGLKAQKIVNIAVNSGYLQIPEGKLVTLKYLDDKNHNDDSDLVVIVTGNRHEPFFMLQRMCKKIDRLIEIHENDLVCMITPAVPGTERMAAKTSDMLLKCGAKVKYLKKNSLKSSHADAQDLKMLYGMLNPKYIIPVVGEYRHQCQQKRIILDYGMSEDKVIMLDNGQVCTFENGVYKGITEKVPVGDVLVDGSVVGDINEVVLKDRELLAEEGVIIVAVTVDSDKKDIVAGPTIVGKGFMTTDLFNEFSEEVKDLVAENIYTYMYKRYIDWNEAQNMLREKVKKLVNKKIKKNPIVLVTIVDIKNKDMR